MQKTALRKKAKIIREQLDMPAVSRQIRGQIKSLPAFKACQHCLLFYPTSTEVDLREIMANHPEKRFYLPRIKVPQNTLAFHHYQPDDRLKKNQYHVKEPLETSPLFPTIAEPEDTLVIVPALMADRHGYRLGYGQSYYDRYLKTLNEKITTLIVIPKELLTHKLPRDSWDVPLDWIVTGEETLKRLKTISET